MRILMEKNVFVSEVMLTCIGGIFAKGGHLRMQIQDVQEHLEEADPLRAEAAELRAKYGNFYIERGRLS